MAPLERWQSGRMRRFRKPVGLKGSREFESPPLREAVSFLLVTSLGFEAAKRGTIKLLKTNLHAYEHIYCAQPTKSPGDHYLV